MLDGENMIESLIADLVLFLMVTFGWLCGNTYIPAVNWKVFAQITLLPI